MHGHPDEPDMTRRRCVSSLRTDLGLRPVPPYVGTKLQTVTAFAYAKAEIHLRRPQPRYAALSPDRQHRLLRALAQAVEEFTCIVENQPIITPTVDLVLIDIAREADQPERFLIALHIALEQVRSAMRELWTRLPYARPYSRRLETALARYVERLCERTINALHPPTTGPIGLAEEARLAKLFARAEHQWGGEPGQLCLRIGALAPDHPAPAARRHPVTPDRPNPAGPLVLKLGDHVLAIIEHRALAPQANQADRVARPARPTDAICIGPFPAAELAAAYQIALLRFRVVEADIAAPLPPTLLPLPDLGFLHTSPTQATVATIAKLLEPLTKQSAHRRTALARTLQLRLQATGTAQELASQLKLHPHTVHNHLVELDKLYSDHDLDLAGNTLAIQAALAIVLPLWELEARATR